MEGFSIETLTILISLFSTVITTAGGIIVAIITTHAASNKIQTDIQKRVTAVETNIANIQNDTKMIKEALLNMNLIKAEQLVQTATPSEKIEPVAEEKTKSKKHNSKKWKREWAKTQKRQNKKIKNEDIFRMAPSQVYACPAHRAKRSDLNAKELRK